MVQYLEACSWDLSAAVDLFLTRATEEDPGTRKRKEPTLVMLLYKCKLFKLAQNAIDIVVLCAMLLFSS